jgi:hypothetical protein
MIFDVFYSDYFYCMFIFIFIVFLFLFLFILLEFILFYSFYFYEELNEKNKGFQLLAKMGFSKGMILGNANVRQHDNFDGKEKIKH